MSEHNLETKEAFGSQTIFDVMAKKLPRAGADGFEASWLKDSYVEGRMYVNTDSYMQQVWNQIVSPTGKVVSLRANIDSR